MSEGGFSIQCCPTSLKLTSSVTEHEDPVKVELELNGFLPAAARGDFSLRMILHGRRVCFARKPNCEQCVLEDFCPSSTVPRRRRSAA